MFTKKQAIEFAKQYQWTAKDAERAFETIDLKDANDLMLLTAMAEFAGKELFNRQKSQASYKGKVTIKDKYIKEIELDFAQKIGDCEKAIHQQRSLFVQLIAKFYNFSKFFGVKDPWVETLLSEYEEHMNNEIKNDAA